MKGCDAVGGLSTYLVRDAYCLASEAVLMSLDKSSDKSCIGSTSPWSGVLAGSPGSPPGGLLFGF